VSTTNELTAALADLAKADMAFTTDIRSDGKKTYIVDSVVLSEDELVLLHRKGALTQAGIRHYLVDRGGNAHRSNAAQLQSELFSDDIRNHLENCAEGHAIPEELIDTDRGMIRGPASPLERKKAA
jgi:hypothetical protein